MPSLTEYVGADPLGISPPDLTTVPGAMANPDLGPIDLRFALAFATEQPAGSGNFQPVWDPSLTPSLISQVKQTTGATFVASLGGGNVSWIDPPDVEGWISTATSSLSSLIGAYELAGIDIDYEGGVADSNSTGFATAISQVMNNLLGMGPLQLSIAPYRRTWPVYQQVVKNVGPTGMVINYQAYAEGLTNQQAYLDLYADLAMFVESVSPPGLGGYYDLALGIDTSTQKPRGLQGEDITAVCGALHGQNGLANAFVWCAEYSAPSGFPIESNVVHIFGT
jgi:hypothetical protein